jgi:hypothetical protein
MGKGRGQYTPKVGQEDVKPSSTVLESVKSKSTLVVATAAVQVSSATNSCCSHSPTSGGNSGSSEQSSLAAHPSHSSLSMDTFFHPRRAHATGLISFGFANQVENYTAGQRDNFKRSNQHVFISTRKQHV